MSTQSQPHRTFGPDFVLDLEDPAYIQNPYPTYQWLREHAPAYRWRAHADAVVFTRHPDVRALVFDRRFTNDYRQWEFAQEARWPAEHAEYKEVIDHGLFALSDENHLRVRKLVSGAFTPRAAERMRGEVQATVDHLIDTHARGPRFNLTAITESLPITVISDMLKIPTELRADFREFGLAVVRSSILFNNAERMFELIAPMPRWLGMLRGVIEARRAQPLENDLLSTLIAAQEEGHKLSEIELISIVQAMIAAGSDTTVHAANWALHTLLTHPNQLALLRAEPTLLRNAVEECLRYDLFGKTGVPRFAKEALEFAGVALRKGQMVIPHIPAALRDGEVFAEPDRFDIRRDVSQTIAFGGGQHFCLGAAVARMQLDTVVGTLVRRVPTMKLAGAPEFQPHPLMRAMSRLDVTVDGA